MKIKRFLHQSKSDLPKCFHQHSNAYEKEPNVDVIAVNGTAVINMLEPEQFKTFKDYATAVFLPCVQNRLRKVQHIDVSWDNYFNDSLKAEHEKNMKKEYREKSKLTQECLTTGKLSSRSTRIKTSDSAISPTN